LRTCWLLHRDDFAAHDNEIETYWGYPEIPPVERLTPEDYVADWHHAQVLDTEAYDLQMRRLLGLV
jgi:hypothetical protein